MILKRLTEDQLNKWEQDGCLYIPYEEIYSSEVKGNLIKWVDEVQNFPETKGKWMKYYENSLKDGTKILNRIEKFSFLS
ncbi:hypothetical protein ACFFIX_15575 [Metabacillus herbersteinensis]|uniref:Uncharacterized protein n=1 Tax=Metabacillus herbersteinensis TaxID=283816 RepID=A0ABV6GGR2_9BACI